MIKALNRSIRIMRKENIDIIIKSIFVCVLAVIVSKGNILGYSPMLVACYASVVNQKRIRFLVLTSLVVGLLMESGTNIIKYLLILVVLSTFVYMFEFFKIHIKNLVLISMITTFIVTASLPVYFNDNPYGLLGAGVEGLAVGLFAIFFKAGLNNFMDHERDHPIEVGISIGVITFAAILGVYGFEFITQTMVNIVLVTGIIYTGYYFGIELVGIISLAIGFALSYVYGGLEYYVIYSGLGISVGIFRKLDKIGCLVGGILTYVGLWSVYGYEESLALAKMLIVVSCIYMLMPVRKQALVEKEVVDIAILKEKLDKFALSYANLGKMFKNISRKKDHISKEEIDQLIDDVASRVCLSCSMCEICWKKKFYQTYRTVYSVLAELEVKGQVYVEDIPKGFYEDCIKADEFVRMINKMFELYKTNLKWENKLNDCREIFSEQFNNVATSLIAFSDSLSDLDKINEKYRQKINKYLLEEGIKPRQVSVLQDERGKLQIIIELYSQYVHVDEMLQSLNAIVKTNFRIESGREEIKGYTYTFVEKEVYKLMKGISKRSKDGKKVSGDNFTVIELNDGKELVAISDGMGSGIKAFRDSEMAIELLEQLLEGGFELSVILKTINSLLGVKNNYESFATMDVSMVDRYSGMCTIIKNGAVSTFVKKGSDVNVVTGEALPFGIVKDVGYTARDIQLDSGDYLVMVSDGVLENKSDVDGENVLIEYLENTKMTSPQKMSEEIISLSQRVNDEDYDDDMTVIVLEMIKGF